MKRGVRFFNMYISVFFSVVSVVFFIGLLCCLILTAENVINSLKSKATLCVTLKNVSDSTVHDRFTTFLETVSFCSRYKLNTKEEVLSEYKRTFSEDPEKLLGYNPFSDIYDVYLVSKYVRLDSVRSVVRKLEKLPYIDKVIISDDMFSIFGDYFYKVIIGIVGIIIFLMLIAEILIINTIRLQIYSKRFIISTMRLVGATAWRIKKPFVLSYFIVSTLAFILVIIVLALLFSYCKSYAGVELFDVNYRNVGYVSLVCFTASTLITTLSAYFACGKYIKLKSYSLYEV